MSDTMTTFLWIVIALALAAGIAITVWWVHRITLRIDRLEDEQTKYYSERAGEIRAVRLEAEEANARMTDALALIKDTTRALAWREL